MIPRIMPRWDNDNVHSCVLYLGTLQPRRGQSSPQQDCSLLKEICMTLAHQSFSRVCSQSGKDCPLFSRRPVSNPSGMSSGVAHTSHITLQQSMGILTFSLVGGAAHGGSCLIIGFRSPGKGRVGLVLRKVTVSTLESSLD